MESRSPTPPLSATERRSDVLPDAARAEAADTPLGAGAIASAPLERGSAEATGHYGAGYGDTTRVADTSDPADHRAAFGRWREREMQAMDADYAAWCETGQERFPDDFDAWRRERRAALVKDHSPAGLPLASATEAAPESEKAALLFERS